MRERTDISKAAAMEADELQLQQWIADGSEVALYELIRRFWGNSYGFALSYLGRAELAEEVTQDIFTNLWLTRDILSSVNILKDYLFIMTRNQVYSAFRKNLKHQNIERGIDYLFEPGQESSTPASELELKEYQAQIDKAISMLPEKRREVFRLSREEGLNHAQIAERLGIKRTTVNDHLTLALNFIRTYLLAVRNHELLLLLMLFT